MEKKSKKPLFGVLTFSIGALALAASTTYFVIKNNEKPAIRDAEYLVSIGEWVMQPSADQTDCILPEGAVDQTAEPMDCIPPSSVEDYFSNVIWKFTEIGKGTLTTNNHIDDHEFKWSIEDGKLKIETDWLYTIYDEATYSLDQIAQTLEIKREDGLTRVFKPTNQ